MAAEMIGSVGVRQAAIAKHDIMLRRGNKALIRPGRKN
jgi:hypothetical protein